MPPPPFDPPLPSTNPPPELQQSHALLRQLESLRDSLSQRVDQLSSAVERLRVQAGELERALDPSRNRASHNSRTTPRHQVSVDRPWSPISNSIPDSNTRSEPNRPVTTEEMSFILDRASQPPIYIPITSDPFADLPQTTRYAEPEVIATIVRHRPPTGDTDDPFVTREMAREGHFDLPNADSSMAVWERRYGLRIEWTAGNGPVSHPSNPGQRSFYAPITPETGTRRREGELRPPGSRIMSPVQRAMNRSISPLSRPMSTTTPAAAPRQGLPATNTQQQRRTVPTIVRTTPASPASTVTPQTALPEDTDIPRSPESENGSSSNATRQESGTAGERLRPHEVGLGDENTSIAPDAGSHNTILSPTFLSNLVNRLDTSRVSILQGVSGIPLEAHLPRRNNLNTETREAQIERRRRERELERRDRGQHRQDQVSARDTSTRPGLTARGLRVERRMEAAEADRASDNASMRELGLGIPYWEIDLYEVGLPIGPPESLPRDTLRPIPIHPPSQEGDAITRSAREEGHRLRALAQDIVRNLPTNSANRSGSVDEVRRGDNWAAGVSRDLQRDLRDRVDRAQAALTTQPSRATIIVSSHLNPGSEEDDFSPEATRRGQRVTRPRSDTADTAEIMRAAREALDSSRNGRPPRPDPNRVAREIWAQLSTSPYPGDVQNRDAADSNVQARPARDAEAAPMSARNSVNNTTDRYRSAQDAIAQSRARISELARLRQDMALVRNGPPVRRNPTNDPRIRHSGDFTMDLADLVRWGVAEPTLLERTTTGQAESRISGARSSQASEDIATEVIAGEEGDASQTSSTLHNEGTQSLAEDDADTDKETAPPGSVSAGRTTESGNLDAHLWPVPPTGPDCLREVYLGMHDLE